MHLVKCDGCGIVYNAERDSYVSEPVDTFSESFFNDFGNHDLMFETDCNRMKKYFGFRSLSGRTILDLGCGMGLFLQYVKEKGANVVGIEANENLCKIVNESGILCFRSIEDAMKSQCQVDVVYSSSHTLEHFLDPFEALMLSRGLIKSDGGVFFTIPCLNFVTLQLERFLKKFNLQGGWGLFYFVHMTFFNRKTLKDVFRKSGYQNLRVMPGVLGENYLHKLIAKRRIVEFLYKFFLLPFLWISSWFFLTPNLSILGRVQTRNPIIESITSI